MPVLLDTRDVAADERTARWSRSASELFAPMDVRPLHERPFAGRILGHHLGPIGVLRVAGDAHRVRRTVEDVALHDPDRLHVSLLTRGSLVIGQDGRSCRLRAGDMTSIDTSRPFEAKANARFEIITFTIPKSMLGDRVDEITTHTATRLPGDIGLTRVAGPFFVGVAAGLHDGSIESDDPYLAESVVGLVRALHGDRPAVAPELARAEGLRAQIIDFIELHLREPDLGPERIARAHFISTRYVHKLFKPDNTTVAAYIRTRRLEGMRRDLEDPALAGRPIGALATSWGFRDPARFSRTFRTVYGCSPTEARTVDAPRSPGWA